MDANEVRGLTRRYGALLAVDHVSFAARRDELAQFYRHRLVPAEWVRRDRRPDDAHLQGEAA